MAAARVPFAEIEAVFLDAGNTLLHWDYTFVREILAGEGVACSLEALERAEHAARPGLSRFIAEGVSTEGERAFLAYAAAILERAAPDVARLAAEERAALATRLLRALRAPGAGDRLWSRVPDALPAALGSLRDAGLRLVVVSNSDGTVERKLAEAGLRPLFDAVVDSHVVGSEKPDRAIFDHAIQVAGTAPERTVHVGDLYHVDVTGAQGAGLHAVLLDPYDDWQGFACERASDVADVARRVLASRPQAL